jgi:hypothetical protein
MVVHGIFETKMVTVAHLRVELSDTAQQPMIAYCMERVKPCFDVV